MLQHSVYFFLLRHVSHNRLLLFPDIPLLLAACRQYLPEDGIENTSVICGGGTVVVVHFWDIHATLLVHILIVFSPLGGSQVIDILGTVLNAALSVAPLPWMARIERLRVRALGLTLGWLAGKDLCKLLRIVLSVLQDVEAIVLRPFQDDLVRSSKRIAVLH